MSTNKGGHMDKPLDKIMNDTTRDINKFLSHHMDQYSLGNGQFGILYEVSKEEGIWQETIAQRRNVGKSAVAKSIKRLIENGYLFRKKDEIDKRAWCLYCTEKGRKMIPIIVNLIETVKKLLTKGSSEEEIKIFRKVNERMSKNIEDYFKSIEG